MQALTLEQFLLTDTGSHTKVELQRMVDSPNYHTITSYDVMVGRPSPFVERHLNYLVAHQYVKPAAYLTNLKVMAKVRQ